VLALVLAGLDGQPLGDLGRVDRIVTLGSDQYQAAVVDDLRATTVAAVGGGAALVFDSSWTVAMTACSGAGCSMSLASLSTASYSGRCLTGC